MKCHCLICNAVYDLIDLKDKRSRGFCSQECEDVWDSEYSSRPTIKEMKESMVK